MGTNATFHIHVKSEQGYSLKYPKHISVLLESICHITALITNCDSSQIATTGIPDLSQFVTVAICDGSKHNFSDRKRVHVHIGQFQEGVPTTSFMELITDIHTNRYTIEKTPKWAKMQLSYPCQNRTWVFSQVPRTRFQCYWSQYATSRSWSQIATNHKLRR